MCENGMVIVLDVVCKFLFGVDLVVKVLRERVVGASDVKMDGSLVYIFEYVVKFILCVCEILMVCVVLIFCDVLFCEVFGEEVRV